jgi:hypothetical protein
MIVARRRSATRGAEMKRLALAQNEWRGAGAIVALSYVRDSCRQPR